MICYPTIPIHVLEAIVRACPAAIEVRDHLGDTPLHIAITKHSHNVEGEIKVHGSKIFGALVDANPGVCYVKNKEGMTPLHMYCRYAYMDVGLLKKFIAANRDALTTKTKMGTLSPMSTSPPRSVSETFMHPVVDAEHRSVVGMSELRYRDKGNAACIRDGGYPLHLALANPSVTYQSAKLLIDEAPEVLSLRDKHHRSPLQVALQFNAPMSITGLLFGN
mmetsp:Transcript_16464/g.25693  ORF Transcript_16464/g.25693 Transcript_16464/m.25693 type:complete len:220 (+) Transcript_16464:177-836(+)|eukprot:CAMPEP_0196823556 /NCGR_PEP_ID=MMETSP1362-20130617/88003_1 /TAXON_ID=163516 /ORGANISM="Leptocylindrus danicus, Strain CCMP1856" /LENGTH=219 /DNA_ID=CAMNT_0042203461 /DNA_START=174 /DNA_END=833 /DNA_ORIENTATION=+